MSNDEGVSRPAVPHVLVVDDEEITRSLVVSKVALLRVATLEAADGSEAWRVMLQRDISLAIVDLEMPNLDGVELLRCMRGHPRTRHIPVIVLTWRDDKSAIESALAAGATSYLTKPLNWALFGDHIRHVLGILHGPGAIGRPAAVA